MLQQNSLFIEGLLESDLVWDVSKCSCFLRRRQPMPKEMCSYTGSKGTIDGFCSAIFYTLLRCPQGRSWQITIRIARHLSEGHTLRLDHLRGRSHFPYVGDCLRILATTIYSFRCFKMTFLKIVFPSNNAADIYKAFKMLRPQRKGVESCWILSRSGSVKHSKKKVW